MANKNLLNDLKNIRKKFNFTRLDIIINELAREIIQDECPHLQTETKKGSCYHGEFETIKCKTCGKTLSITKDK
jgi:nitrite reductase/ring-hydroxylating ferredoxin subunit